MFSTTNDGGDCHVDDDDDGDDVDDGDGDCDRDRCVHGDVMVVMTMRIVLIINMVWWLWSL